MSTTPHSSVGSPSDSALATIEQHLIDLHQVVEQQIVQCAQLIDLHTQLHGQVADLRRRQDWNDAQVAEVLRVIATLLRQVRETQVYGMLSEGPVTASTLRELLQHRRYEGLDMLLSPVSPQSAG
jgi:hypothetical protein